MLKPVLTHQEELRAEIEKLERRQVQRRAHLAEIEALISARQITIDNLKAQLEAIDE